MSKLFVDGASGRLQWNDVVYHSEDNAHFAQTLEGMRLYSSYANLFPCWRPRWHLSQTFYTVGFPKQIY